MPLQKLQFRPGVSRESTDLANEGGWYSCDKVRFRSGAPEKIGGWVPIGSSTFYGTCRDISEWESLSNYLLRALGTDFKFYIFSNQTYYDITPLRLTTNPLPNGVTGASPMYSIYSTLSASISATATTIPVTSGTTFGYTFPLVVRIESEDIYVQNVSGNTLVNCSRGYNNTTAAVHSSGIAVSSSLLVINSVANGAGIGDFVTISNATAFGPYTATVLNNNFQIVSNATNYIAVDVGIQSTSAISGGGVSVKAEYEIPVGANTASYGAGWGASVWTAMLYGAGTTTLNGAINSSVTTITVVSTASFPASGYFIIESEVIQYTGKTGTTFTGCTRATANATAHVSGTAVKEIAYVSPDNPPNTNARAWGTPATTAQQINIPIRIWSSDTFGQSLVMNIRNSAVYYWNTANYLSASGAATLHSAQNFTALSGVDDWAPTVAARVLVTDERHIVVLGTNDPTVGTRQDPLLVRWCEQEDPLIWHPSTTNTAGFQRLSYGSKLITAEKTRQEILIWSDSALYSMRYLGPPYTFGFNTISAEINIASPNAVATSNNITYWMGLDKFYAYSGRVDTLPCSLRQYVFDDINLAEIDQVYAGANEKYNEIWWFYPSSDSQQNNRYVVYNYLEKLWYYGQLPRSSWYDSHISSYPIATTNKDAVLQVTGVTSGVITSVSIVDGGRYLDYPVNPISVVTISQFGSGAQFSFTYGTNASTGVTRTVVSVAIVNGGSGYVNGDILIAEGGSSVGILLYHENGVDNGITNPPSPITCYIESADFDLGDGDHLSFVRRLIPDIDFIGSTNAAPYVDMVISARDFPGQGLFQNSVVEIDTGTKISLQIYNYTNQQWLRLRGRQIAFKVGSDQLGVKWQLGVPRLDIQPDGRRS